MITSIKRKSVSNICIIYLRDHEVISPLNTDALLKGSVWA